MASREGGGRGREEGRERRGEEETKDESGEGDEKEGEGRRRQVTAMRNFQPRRRDKQKK